MLYTLNQQTYMGKKFLKRIMTKKVLVLVLIGILSILMAIVIYLKDERDSSIELFKLVLSSIGGFGIVSATILNVWNALDTSKNNLKQMEFQKIENSIKYLERWDSDILLKARDYTRNVSKRRANITDIQLLNEIKNDKFDYEKYVILIFNFWEEIYLSIENNRVDEEILKRGFREIYLTQYSDFEVWLKDTGKKYKEMSKNLEEFQKMWFN